MENKNKESLIYIIILNYLAHGDTIECIESMDKLNYFNYKIIIVDNGSNNNSFKILSDKYKNSNNIYVVNTGENLGFSNGFNYGIKIAKRHNPDNIVVMNNDMVFTDSNILMKLNKIAAMDPNCVAIGPKIITYSNDNQNPHRLHRPTPLQVVTSELAYHYFTLYRKNRNFFDKVKKLFNPFKEKKFSESKNGIYRVYSIHGSFIFFTKNFFKYFDLPFDDRNFLREEELILGEMIYNHPADIYLAYYPKTEIFHKEDSTMKLVFDDRKYHLDEQKKKHVLNARKIFREYYFKR